MLLSQFAIDDKSHINNELMNFDDLQLRGAFEEILWSNDTEHGNDDEPRTRPAKKIRLSEPGDLDSTSRRILNETLRRLPGLLPNGGSHREERLVYVKIPSATS
jgi:hypothetical protein